jgi:hypothetical protein
MIDPKQYRPEFITRPKIAEVLEVSRKCEECQADLPNHLKYYCSGKCMKEAKEKGTYKSA